MRSQAISIVIPTYNRAALITRALDSVLANAEPDDEIIVVDDGSTDDTPAKLALFGDRVRCVWSPHGGAGMARNIGVRAARRPLVAFLDSDDEWMPGKLALQRALMRERPDVLFCFSDFVSRFPGGERGRQLSRWHRDARSWDEILGPGVPFSSITPLPPGRSDFRVHFGNLYLQEMQRDYVAAFTMVARREQAADALHFAEDVATFEDWECFGRLAGAGTAAYLDCETAWQYGHDGPRLTNATTIQRAEARLRILDRVWGSDAQFLDRNGDSYRKVCSIHHFRLANALLRHGQFRQARHEFRVAHAPLAYTMVAMLPAPAIRCILAMHDALREI